MPTYQWENLEHPQLTILRDEFQLESVVAEGKAEYEKQLLLKEWLHCIIPQGKPERDYYNFSAIEILRDAKAARTMWCTQFVFAYLQCAQALGWQARKLSVDWDHAEDQIDHHHGVVDIWSHDFKKWYVVDAQNNVHFVKDGIPLNALEIRHEWLLNLAKEVKIVRGNFQSEADGDASVESFATPSNYFWVYPSLRNNFFTEPGLFQTQGFLWVDEYTKDKEWWRRDSPNGSHLHKGYEGQFLTTSDVSDLYPVMS